MMTKAARKNKVSGSKTVETRYTSVEQVVADFGAEFAAWRLDGCPGYGFADSFKVRLRKAAGQVGSNYSVILPQVHRTAYVTIDADGCADLGKRA